jgi:hypothetical protein
VQRVRLYIHSFFSGCPLRDFFTRELDAHCDHFPLPRKIYLLRAWSC